MATYYISPSGSNSNDGLSTGAPWLTLSYATANSTSGDTLLLFSGGTWNDQFLSFDTRTIDVYNGSSRALLDYDGSNGGTYFALVQSSGANTSINSLELANNLSGSDQTDGGRGIAFTGSNTTIDDCYLRNIGANGITRDFGGDTASITNCILENIVSLWSSGIYGGGIAPPGSSNAVDGWTITGNQLTRVHGEAISAFTFSTSVRCTGVVINDNDICGGHAAGIYLNGVNGAVVKRNVVLGTTNTSYHRVTGYCGYGIAQDNESATTTTNNDTLFGLNLVAYCSPGFYVSQGVGTDVTAMHVAHNTFVDCQNTVSCISGSSFSGGANVFRQNASILITGGTAHDDGTNVPGAAAWTLNENFWEGGGEHTNLNDASDFSNTAWTPSKASGWQSITAITDITTSDWRPGTQVLGTQYTDPNTSSNWLDYEGTGSFREAGGLANTAAAPSGKVWLILRS